MAKQERFIWERWWHCGVGGGRGDASFEWVDRKILFEDITFRLSQRDKKQPVRAGERTFQALKAATTRT